MQCEFRDAVSRQGTERDELIDAIVSYDPPRRAGADRSVPNEEMMRAIFGGGAVAAGTNAPRDRPERR